MIHDEEKYLNLFQITALAVIPMTWQYWILVVGLIVGGGILFFILAKLGEKIIARDEQRIQTATENKILSEYDNKITISMINVTC
jgi:hypothetical protein